MLIMILIAERRTSETPFKRSWTINWENHRLDFEAGDLSGDNITNVLLKGPVGKQHKIDRMHPSDSFIDIFDGALGVKVNSIVRRNGQWDGEKLFTR
jgi:hypothetical protein